MRAGGVGADRFEDVLDGDVAIVPAARRDRAAVEHEAGNVEARQRHHRGGNRLVAADQHHQRVEQVAARDQLDRVGDDLAADERGPHALAAHGDAVGDRDGVELERRAAGLADPVLHVHGQIAQVIVAGTDLDPGVGDADERLPQILVGQAGGAQHRPRRRPAGAVGQRGAAPLQRMSWQDRCLVRDPWSLTFTGCGRAHKSKKAVPFRMTASRFIARLGSSSAHRPAYNAERNNANDDDQKVQPGGHPASIADRCRNKQIELSDEFDYYCL